MSNTFHIFDLDGTLVDLNPPEDDLDVLRGQLIELAELANADFEHKGIFRLHESLRIVGRAKESSELISKFELRWVDCTARKIELATFALNNWGVVTNNGESAVRRLFERGLIFPGSNPSFVITRDAGLALKPSPAMISMAVSLIPGSSEAVNIVFVGDSLSDEEAVSRYNSIQQADVQMEFRHASLYQS